MLIQKTSVPTFQGLPLRKAGATQSAPPQSSLSHDEVLFGKKENKPTSPIPLRKTRIGLLIAAMGLAGVGVGAGQYFENQSVKTIETRVDNVTSPVVAQAVDNGKKAEDTYVGEGVQNDRKAFAMENYIPEMAKGQAGYSFLVAMQDLGLKALKEKQKPSDLPQYSTDMVEYQRPVTKTIKIPVYADVPAKMDCTGLSIFKKCIGLGSQKTERKEVGQREKQVSANVAAKDLSEVWGNLPTEAKDTLNKQAERFAASHSPADYESLFNVVANILLQSKDDLKEVKGKDVSYVVDPDHMTKMQDDVKLVAADLEKVNQYIAYAGIGTEVGAAAAAFLGLLMLGEGVYGVAARRRKDGGDDGLPPAKAEKTVEDNPPSGTRKDVVPSDEALDAWLNEPESKKSA
jgi:hypothetical protein